MKKLLLTAGIMALITGHSYGGAFNCCVGTGYSCTEFDSSCTNDTVCRCKDEVTEYPDFGYVQLKVNGQTQITQTGNKCSVTCSRDMYYTCEAGYYSAAGRARVGISPQNLQCTSCASATSNTHATSNRGATAITGCFLPNGTTGTDASGTFEYTSDCNYSN